MSRVKTIRFESIFLGYGSTIPGIHFPPAISSNKSITCQKAFSAPIGSAPRSNRLDASVLIPKDFAPFRTTEASKYALSINTLLVFSLTAVSKPPITPAIAMGFLPLVINNSFCEILRSTSSRVVIFSPFLPRRIKISFDPNLS